MMDEIWHEPTPMHVRNQKFEDYLTGEGVDPLRFGPFTRLAFNMHGLVPPEEWLDIMPQIFHVHAKFYDIDENGDEPAMDIPRIVRQFVEGGYQGYLSSEWEGHAFSDLGESDPIELVKKQHALMRRAIEETVTATQACVRPRSPAFGPSPNHPYRTARDRRAARGGAAVRARPARRRSWRGGEPLQPLHVPAQRLPGRADHPAVGPPRDAGHPGPLHERRPVHRVRQRDPLPPGPPSPGRQAHPARHDDPGHRGRRRRPDREGRLAHGRHRVGTDRPRRSPRRSPTCTRPARSRARRSGRTGCGASTPSTSSSRTASGRSGSSAATSSPARRSRRTGSASARRTRARSTSTSCTSATTASPSSCRPPTSRCPARTTRTAPRRCRSSSRRRRSRTTPSKTPSS